MYMVINMHPLIKGVIVYSPVYSAAALHASPYVDASMH